MLTLSICHRKGGDFLTKTDYKGDWRELRKDTPVPFHIQADFNGDGLVDEAWILLGSNNTKWGLFVFLSQKHGSPTIIKLLEDDKYYDRYGINLVEPGKYETCFGKGYDLEYPADEPKVLNLNNPAINFFLYENANQYYWWDERTHSFRSTCISD